MSTLCNLFLSEEKQKSIDIESICQLLQIILGSQYQAQVDSFVEYLKVSDCVCGILQSCMYVDLLMAKVINQHLLFEKKNMGSKFEIVSLLNADSE